MKENKSSGQTALEGATFEPPSNPPSGVGPNYFAIILEDGETIESGDMPPAISAKIFKLIEYHKKRGDSK